MRIKRFPREEIIIDHGEDHEDDDHESACSPNSAAKRSPSWGGRITFACDKSFIEQLPDKISPVSASPVGEVEEVWSKEKIELAEDKLYFDKSVDAERDSGSGECSRCTTSSTSLSSHEGSATMGDDLERERAAEGGTPLQNFQGGEEKKEEQKKEKREKKRGRELSTAERASTSETRPTSQTETSQDNISILEDHLYDSDDWTKNAATLRRLGKDQMELEEFNDMDDLEMMANSVVPLTSGYKIGANKANRVSLVRSTTDGEALIGSNLRLSNSSWR